MIEVSVTAVLQAKISNNELVWAVMRIAKEMCGKPDDAGCDWCTDNKGNTYIANESNWKVSSDPKVALLIDAHYIIRGEEPVKLTGLPDVEEGKRRSEF